MLVAMRSRGAGVGWWLVAAVWCALPVLWCALPVRALQVYRIDTADPRLVPQPLQMTHVELSQEKLQPKTRQQLIRILQAEQAYTLRAFPLSHHGLVLKANGGVAPDGVEYQHVLQQYGVASKPGGKVQITDIRIESDRVVLELNGGPDKKHHWLHHISVGGSLGERQLAPDEPDAVGSRVTLQFAKYVPEMTGEQVKALLAPLLDFSMKSNLQAYIDTLPPVLRSAIREHRVLVGMNREMVLDAVSAPERKVREETATGEAYEDWIYGKPPKEVQFVRFVGDRVVQVEVAAIGKDPVVRDKDETNGYLASQPQRERTVAEGDDAPGQRAAPTLRRPGETAPSEQPQPVKAPG